jgi:hypothetical protein
METPTQNPIPQPPIPPVQPPLQPQPVQQPIQQPPIQPVATQPMQTTPAPEKKSSPWPWIVGGCLLIVIIIMAAIFGLGWWGARKLKTEIEKSQTIENVKNNVDKMGKESEEWQKKSEEMRNSLPNPEDLNSKTPSSQYK